MAGLAWHGRAGPAWSGWPGMVGHSTAVDQAIWQTIIEKIEDSLLQTCPLQYEFSSAVLLYKDSVQMTDAEGAVIELDTAERNWKSMRSCDRLLCFVLLSSPSWDPAREEARG